MIKLPGYILLSVLLVFSFTQLALAQPEITAGNDFSVGARAMGMGGAFVGLADDFTALYWNPAGLSQIKRMEFFAGLSHEKLEAETKYFADFDSTFASNTRPNSIGIVLPVPVYRGGLAFAIGVNRVQSFDSRIRFTGFNDSTEAEDPDFYQLSVSELFDESGGMYSWSFGTAVDVAPGVSLGGAINFLSGDYTYELEVDADDTEEIDSELFGFSYRDSVDSDYFGVEAKIGLLARLGKQVRLGATIDIPLDSSVDEYWIQDSFFLNDDGTNESFPDDGFFSYDISRPFRFGGGVAACLAPGAIVSADVLYTDWTQTEYSDTPSESVSNDDFIEDYRDILQVRVGAEYGIPSLGLRIRGGYLYDPLPYTPEGTEIDSERQFITAGIGMMLDRTLSLDIAYMRGFWKESSDDGVIVKDRDSHRILLSSGYRF